MTYSSSVTCSPICRKAEVSEDARSIKKADGVVVCQIGLGTFEEHLNEPRKLGAFQTVGYNWT